MGSDDDDDDDILHLVLLGVLEFLRERSISVARHQFLSGYLSPHIFTRGRKQMCSVRNARHRESPETSSPNSLFCY
jgi:hypothetical protein